MPRRIPLPDSFKVGRPEVGRAGFGHLQIMRKKGYLLLQC
jgi:hypothetical protein